MGLWITPFALAAALAAWFILPRAWRIVSVARLRRRCARRRAVCLTYDDGPGADLTRAIMDLVESHAGRATFFMLGANARRHPELVAEVRRRGHLVGSHSRDHLNAWTKAPWHVSRDIRAGIQDVEPLAGRPGPFRPPYGRATLASLAHALFLGRPPVWWTLDGGDTHATPPDPEHPVRALKRHGGGVVLLHDFDHHRRPERTKYVLDATRHILEWAHDTDARICTHEDLMRTR